MNRNRGRKLRRCTRCLRVAYCNRNCQSKHYRLHKKGCRKYAANTANEETSPKPKHSNHERPRNRERETSTQANTEQNSSEWIEHKKSNVSPNSSPRRAEVVTNKKMINQFALRSSGRLKLQRRGQDFQSGAHRPCL